MLKQMREWAVPSLILGGLVFAVAYTLLSLAAPPASTAPVPLAAPR